MYSGCGSLIAPSCPLVVFPFYLKISNLYLHLVIGAVNSIHIWFVKHILIHLCFLLTYHEGMWCWMKCSAPKGPMTMIWSGDHDLQCMWPCFNLMTMIIFGKTHVESLCVSQWLTMRNVMSNEMFCSERSNDNDLVCWTGLIVHQLCFYNVIFCLYQICSLKS